MRATLIAVACVALGATAQIAADDHNDFMFDVTRIEVKMGHDMQFREGVKAYMDCYAKAGGGNSWSTWRNVDGAGNVYRVVSVVDSWARLDERDEAGASCRPTIREQVEPHMASVNTMYARRQPGWSPDEISNEATIVRLHNFSVDNDGKFRAAIKSMTGVMKASGYEHMGNWYEVIGGGVDDPEYFVAVSYRNFAAMDEDRAGAYGTMKKHAGEDAANLIWGEYLDSLEDGDSYWSNLLRVDQKLSYRPD